MRMKICRIESATLHKSFFLINPFKLGYTDIKRHGVKQNPFTKEMRPGRGSLCTCDKTNAFECCREVTALQRHFREVNTGLQTPRATSQNPRTEGPHLECNQTLSRPHPNRTEPALPNTDLTKFQYPFTHSFTQYLMRLHWLHRPA